MMCTRGGKGVYGEGGGGGWERVSVLKIGEGLAPERDAGPVYLGELTTLPPFLESWNCVPVAFQLFAGMEEQALVAAGGQSPATDRVCAVSEEGDSDRDGRRVPGRVCGRGRPRSDAGAG